MYPQPPYVLLIAGFLAAIAAGSSFSATLQQSTQAWAADRTQSLQAIRGFSLQLPYFGICAGTCIFLASGVQLFGFPASGAYGISAPITALMAWLVWRQLGVILTQLEQGGSKALDLEEMF
ncbi:MAG: hypothetical protein O3A14_04135 [Cyanobacteria bacterium]|nr:hypothetical protein [Cyanobacteriota bacterium]